ncbi:MAG: hypothetical protein M0P31_15245 [Solirubrobacteraceae bacterium]|nr:hypothetical protein [Solirubrobacteraceae bacterium]
MSTRATRSRRTTWLWLAFVGTLTAIVACVGPWGVPSASATGASLTVDAERRGGSARLVVQGRSPRSAGPTAVRVTSVPTGMACAVPTLARGGRLVGTSGMRWRALSPLRAGSPMRAGRTFTMTGDVRMPSDGASVACVHLVTVSARPRVLATRAAELPSRASGVLAPFVGESAAPVVGAWLPAIVVIFVAIVIRAIVVRARHRRRARDVRAPSARRRPSVGHRSTNADPSTARLSGHRRSGAARPTRGDGAAAGAAVDGLPDLPEHVVVPDVVPASLLRDARSADPTSTSPRTPEWIVAARDRASSEPVEVEPAAAGRRRSLGIGAPGRATARAVRRACADLGPEVDDVAVPRGAGDGRRHGRVVVARTGRLAFLLLPVGGVPSIVDIERAGRIAAELRDTQLEGLSPMPVLVHPRAGVAPVTHGTAPDYPVHAVWSVSADGLVEFVRARTPRRRSRSRAHSPHGA